MLLCVIFDDILYIIRFYRYTCIFFIIKANPPINNKSMTHTLYKNRILTITKSFATLFDNHRCNLTWTIAHLYRPRGCDVFMQCSRCSVGSSTHVSPSQSPRNVAVLTNVSASECLSFAARACPHIPSHVTLAGQPGRCAITAVYLTTSQIMCVGWYSSNHVCQTVNCETLGFVVDDKINAMKEPSIYLYI